MPHSIAVYLEAGAKRTFACAVDWPGWTRGGRDAESALAALEAVRHRYALVATQAGLELPVTTTFDVIETVPGNATTDFGAPGVVPECDLASLPAEELKRSAGLVEAACRHLDGIVKTAPAGLRKGPRGGGRDRDAIYQHVLSAEQSYAAKLEVRVREPQVGDLEAIAAVRAAILGAIRSPVPGARWPPRFGARRIAWHVLDHAWEIQDRS